MQGRLSGFHDLTLLALRLFLGAFLIYGVWDNIVSSARMDEFEQFLTGIRCPMPALAAPLSVWAQFAIGALLIPGLWTRWAGLVLAVNFTVAVVLLLGVGQDFRQLFPPAILIFIGLSLASGGAGRVSLDHLIKRRSPVRA